VRSRVHGPRRWGLRLLLPALVAAGVLLVGAPARAHEVGGVGATNFHTTLSALAPATPGLRLSVVDNGSRLELVNDTPAEAVVAGYAGEPYARVGPDGVFLNQHSPATYLNADRFSATQVPATADPARAPEWTKVADGPVWRWHDHRVHWMLRTLPAAVAADPGSSHRISTWTLTLDHDGRRLTATGTLDWVPGSSPWPWFVLVAVLAAAMVLAVAWPRRPHRVLAVATGALVVLDIGHAVTVVVATSGTVPEKLGGLFGSASLLLWPFALFAAALLWQRHTRAAWISAAVGFVVAVTLVVEDAPVWWRSSAPAAVPGWVNRTIVALVVGIGLGLVIALPVLLRRFPRTPAPTPTGTPGTETTPTAPPATDTAPTEASSTPPRTNDIAPHHGSGAGVAWTEERRERSDQSDEGRRRIKGSGARASGASAKEQSASANVIDRRRVTGYLAVGALGALAGAAAGATAAGSGPAPPGRDDDGPALREVGARSVPFHGRHQAGIERPGRPQAYGWVAGFDLVPGADPEVLRALLRGWTDAAAGLSAGRPLGPTDTVTAGAGPAALTVTVGFGPSLFGRAGVPAGARPAALAPLPAVPGERLDPARGGGDLGLVVAADDAMAVARAARALSRVAAPAARVRWAMSGFTPARGAAAEDAPQRNLMGQVEGTNNPRPGDPDFAARVFVDAAVGPDWLVGGSYLVVRRIRMLLDAWDEEDLAAQEAVLGRRKRNGAPLTGGGERTPVDFAARGPDGRPVVGLDAHIRLAAPAFNGGAAMLRRGFSYVDGVEAGLLFLAWQADPRRGFLPVHRRLAADDALHRFVRHEAGALFAAPGGVAPGGYYGQSLVERL
jgi:deferrochelatase/peroxidase EfeB